MTHDGMRIAVIGSRGIPARYGGFETFAQELAPRLVERGHEVTVYCRRPDPGEPRPGDYRGVRLRYASAVRKRSLEQLSHEFSSIVDSIRRPTDVYYFLGYRGAPLYLPLRLSRRSVVINMDGFEWKRRKWNRLGRLYLRVAEWIAARLAADRLVADAEGIRSYLQRAHGRDSVTIRYGAYALGPADRDDVILEEHSLRAGDYYLVVCRIEPENNVDLMIREFITSGSERELVIVGGMNYETPYWRALQQAAAGGRVRFLGPVYGPGRVESLYLGAYAYLHGHEVGGTNPALLTAMGCGACPIALDTEFNRENAVDTGRYFTKQAGSLAEQVRWADAHPAEVAAIGERARERIRLAYDWETVADEHDRLFRALLPSRSSAG